MRNLIINGGKRLEGSVNIHGAKNSVLPLISAAVLSDGKSVLHNCPDLSDVSAALNIIEFLGLTYKKSGSDIEIFSQCPTCYEIPDNLMSSMRSSVMFLGSILARKNKAVISLPGGCRLGPRPIDIHIAALKRLGAKVTNKGGKLEFSAQGGLKGADVFLKFPSVGATENVILSAATAKGKTRIFNAAKEPEIVDLADFLNKSGADIQGAGTGVIVINGVRKLYGVEHTVIPDRIEAATYMAVAAATGGKITLNNVNLEHLSAVNGVFRQCGCEITGGKNRFAISAPSRLNSVKRIVTGVYPGFPTDAGPLLMGALASADGTSVFYERIFKNRYIFAGELKKFGANIQTFRSVAAVKGVSNLHGAECVCTDLRGGAALVIAALRAQGKTNIGNICHIKRGYEQFADNLKKLGADIIET